MSEQDIFIEAMKRENPEERRQYLDEICGEDHVLRERLDKLMKHSEEVASFLESPAAEFELTDIRPITEQPGNVIGPFKLLEQIGEGGMGTVFMAEQSEPIERRVALKIIKPGMDSQQVIARFEAERQALAMMDHPHIAKVLDAGTTQTGRPYFVMELVNGIPITQYCDRQHLSPKERLKLFVPVCQAVQHAHQKGIIHRDLKPSNILVTHYDNKPVPKVIDFGVAKAISHNLIEKSMFTQFGTIVGTVEYMSPEQARFNQSDVDTRSDIYSLGVLLYELLTAETPFDKQRLRSAAFDELLRILGEEEPPKPSLRLSSSQTLPSIAANRKIEPQKLSTLVRGELDWIVMKALEKDRGRRYDTASALAADIKHFLNDEAVTACPPSAIYKFRKFARRNKVVIGTTAAVAASLIAGIIGISWQAYAAGRERDRALIAERNAVRETERATEAERLAEERLAIVSRQKDEIAAEQRRADREASIAKAVNQFLNRDLLGMAGPGAQVEGRLAPDPDIKLRTLLDRAADKIDERFADQPLLEAAIRHTIGATYDAIGEYKLAEEQMQRALELRQKTLGREHALSLTTTNDLAYVFNSQGRFAESERLYRQTLAIRRRTLGEEHADTLVCMQNLAGVLANQHRYDEAEHLYQRTLEICRRTLGDEHAETLKSMHNLALIYREQRRCDEAEELFQKTLEILKRTLGESHPFTLSCMHNLSRVMDYQGRFQEAEQLNRRTLAIRRRTLGEEHPVTLRSMHTLAIVVCNQRRYDEAEQLNRQTLAIRRRRLGEQHPDTLGSMTNLAIVLCKQRRFDEAEQLHRETLAVRRKTLGEEDADTIMSMYHLALVHRGQGRYDEAEQLLRRTMEMQTRTLGESHPGTLCSMHDLARVMVHQGRLDEAEQLFQQTLAARRRILGHDHADTLNSMHHLATLMFQQARYADAERLFHQIREIQKRKLGDKHPATLRNLHNLIIASMCQKQYVQAETLANELVDGLRQHDEQPPEVLLSALQTLLVALKAQHKYTELENVYRKSYEIAASELDEKSALRSQIEECYARFCTNRSWTLVTAADPTLRDSREAVRLARIAAQLRPQYAKNYSNLAVALYRDGRFVDAVETFQKADEMVEGGDLGHRMFYAMAQWRLGDRDRAMELFHEGDDWIKAKRKDFPGHQRFRDEAEQLLKISPVAELHIEQPLRVPRTPQTNRDVNP